MNDESETLEAAVLRLAMEYVEMPDLKLTAAQARRLCGLSAELCEGAMATLVARGFLVQTAAGAFLRRTPGARFPLPQAS